MALLGASLSELLLSEETDDILDFESESILQWSGYFRMRDFLAEVEYVRRKACQVEGSGRI